MPRPVVVKLGGSLVTDKAEEGVFQKPVARRLLAEVAKSGLPSVVLHGAGSFGHPGVARHGIGAGPMTAARREGVSEVLASVTVLQGHMVHLAQDVGLKPMPFPMHALATREESGLILPFGEVSRALAEGHTPIIGGTLVRDGKTGWSVAGADEMAQILAPELEARLAVFATDVDGIYDRDPKAGGEPAPRLIERIRPGSDVRVDGSGGRGSDVTGRMTGKLERSLSLARTCPVLIVNGLERNRLLDALRGKQVPCTRIE